MALDGDLDPDIVVLSDSEGELPSVTTPALTSSILPVFRQTSTNPASHHALACAYSDLKRRYNDLESKYRNISRQLKNERPASFVMATSSQRDALTNGAEGDFNHWLVEREDLLEQVDHWKKRCEDLDSKIAQNIQKETHMTELWQRARGRGSGSNVLEAALERHQISQANLENDGLRRDIKRLESRLVEQEAEMNSVKEEAAANKMKEAEAIQRLDCSRRRYEDLCSELNKLRDDMKLKLESMKIDPHAATSEEEVKSLTLAISQAQQETIQLKRMVGDQQEIITLLLKRLQPNKIMPHINSIPGPSTGARPKYLTSDGDMRRIKQCTDGDLHTRSQIVTNGATPPGGMKRHTVASMDLGMEGLLSSDGPISSPRTATRTVPLIARSLSHEAEPLSTEKKEFATGAKQRWSSEDATGETPSHYDDLTFGNKGEETTLMNVNGDHVMEMDSPQNTNEELDIYGQGEDGVVHNVPARGNEVENRFRPIPSGSQPRPLNIERNLSSGGRGGSPRSHDNNLQNVNLDMGTTPKYNEPTVLTPRQQYLNNHPLVGHKTIASRNLYPQSEQQNTQRPLAVGEQGDGSRSRSGSGSGSEPRVCPVCNQEFEEEVPMGDFQQHVLDCVGPPTPPKEDRCCPICSSVFPDVVSQEDFEAHVNNHFADENDPLHFEVIDPQ